MWLNYTHRDRTSDNVLDEQFINIVSNNYDSVFEDMNYDDKDWLFPCVFEKKEESYKMLTDIYHEANCLKKKEINKILVKFR